MTGYVHTINRRRGLVAIATNEGGFTVLELRRSDPISIGDRMQWDAEETGSAVYLNQTRASRITVAVLAHRVSDAEVRQLLRL